MTATNIITSFCIWAAVARSNWVVSANFPCNGVSVSYCENNFDDPDFILETHCSFDECKQLCDEQQEESGCEFVEYLHKEEHCTLWSKKFDYYVHQCGMLGAPKDVADDCDIDMEDPNDICSMIRFQDCLTGETEESIEGLPDWKICKQACKINESCSYWTWERERKLCRLSSIETPPCYRTLSPSQADVDTNNCLSVL